MKYSLVRCALSVCARAHVCVYLLSTDLLGGSSYFSDCLIYHHVFKERRVDNGVGGQHQNFRLAICRQKRYIYL
ncbi:hypothetical protein RHMOL_Rhmol06G0190900 [Rhododendron molle]|uniref:Uncharacterized protein n=1 Tax=Rhododendron molle TaxID=49168 RepID=A0ACC0NF08_RHOML|nr:hypothetical protein RHMOL_Rhmol06G0190900 [Rhododendron molle]